MIWSFPGVFSVGKLTVKIPARTAAGSLKQSPDFALITLMRREVSVLRRISRYPKNELSGIMGLRPALQIKPPGFLLMGRRNECLFLGAS